MNIHPLGRGQVPCPTELVAPLVTDCFICLTLRLADCNWVGTASTSRPPMNLVVLFKFLTFLTELKVIKSFCIALS